MKYEEYKFVNHADESSPNGQNHQWKSDHGTVLYHRQLNADDVTDDLVNVPVLQCLGYMEREDGKGNMNETCTLGDSWWFQCIHFVMYWLNCGRLSLAMRCV